MGWIKSLKLFEATVFFPGLDGLRQEAYDLSGVNLFDTAVMFREVFHARAKLTSPCRVWSPILKVAACTRASSMVQAQTAHHLLFSWLPVLRQNLNPHSHPHLPNFTAPTA